MLNKIEIARNIMTTLCYAQREEREAVENCFGSISKADNFQKQERQVQLLKIKWMLTKEQYNAFYIVYC